jgi:hypothetical protein
MRDELLRQLDKDLERQYITQEQYNSFKAEIMAKSEQLDKLVADHQAGKIDDDDFYNWSESIAEDYRKIGERWRKKIEVNAEERKHKAEMKHKKPFIYGFLAIILVLVAYFGITYLYEHRSISDVPEPVQIMMSDEERDEVHVVNGKDIGLDDYRLEMHYLASYDIQGIVLDTKHIKIQTAFDKSFPVDVGIAWGEMAANRNLVNCTNGPRKMSCTYDMDEIMKKTEAKRAIRDMVSNNHLSPADKDIYDKIMRIRKGNYIRIQGYLVQFAVNDNMDSHLYEGVSSLTRTDRMSSIFDTTNTGCELIYVTSVEWLD